MAKDKNMWVLLAAIASLTVLEVTAMINDVNGYLFSLIVIAIAGIAGCQIPDVIKRIRKR